MLEAIRVIVMERMDTMRRLSEKWPTEICPSIQKRLEWSKDQQRYWHVVFAGGSQYECRQGNEAFKVDEEKKTCSCRMWQISGIPCPHAVAVVFKIRKTAEDYLPDWFRRETYLKAYTTYLKPVGGMSTWVPNNLNKPLPPKPKVMPGRPRVKRIRAANEGGGSGQRISRAGTIMTCQNCFQQGHNKNGCTNEKRQPPKKAARKVGRPRKDNGGPNSGGNNNGGNNNGGGGPTGNNGGGLAGGNNGGGGAGGQARGGQTKGA